MTPLTLIALAFAGWACVATYRAWRWRDEWTDASKRLHSVERDLADALQLVETVQDARLEEQTALDDAESILTNILLKWDYVGESASTFYGDSYAEGALGAAKARASEVERNEVMRDLSTRIHAHFGHPRPETPATNPLPVSEQHTLYAWRPSDAHTLHARAADALCPMCIKPRTEWGLETYQKDGVLYCSRECADASSQ